MTNLDSTTDANDNGNATATESKRKQVSKRAYIDSQGTECDRIEQAAGAQYILLSPSGNKSFNELFENDRFKTMCAIMGFHTKIGNVANTVLNDKDEPGTPDDAAQAIEDWLKAAKDDNDPQWAERSAGPVGTRIDKAALHASILAVAAADGTPVDDAKAIRIMDKLESDPQYVRAVRANAKVAAEYARRVGKPAKTVEDLLNI